MSPEKYQPSPREIREAEESMTDFQGEQTAEREDARYEARKKYKELLTQDLRSEFRSFNNGLGRIEHFDFNAQNLTDPNKIYNVKEMIRLTRKDFEELEEVFGAIEEQIEIIGE